MNKHSLYNALIAPRSKDPNVRNQELVLNWLLAGSLALAFVTFIEAFLSLLILQEAYLWGRLLSITALFVLFAGLLSLSRRRQQQRLPSIILIAIFYFSAVLVITRWDILAPSGVLLFSLVVVMASILLGARFALYAALLTALALSGVELAKAGGYLHPDLSWMKQPSNFNDVASFTAIYGIIALVSWLFNRQMEQALARAQRSEKALKRQRDLLEVKVEQRTRALQAAQLEEIQQVYRFAELGHLSTALFHDLANHLMSISIDIEGLRQGQRSDIMARIRDNVHHIDEVVRRVQRQIRGQNEPERFNVTEEIKEVAQILAYFSDKSGVTIEISAATKTPLAYRGDLTRFRQVMMNLLSNAIESYQGSKLAAERRVVAVSAEKQPGGLVILVTDYGKGISSGARERIFEPFYSTKDKGMGIGLFIVKKVVEEDFGGAISVSSKQRAGTTFMVTLPLGGNGRSTKNAKK